LPPVIGIFPLVYVLTLNIRRWRDREQGVLKKAPGQEADGSKETNWKGIGSKISPSPPLTLKVVKDFCPDALGWAGSIYEQLSLC